MILTGECVEQWRHDNDRGKQENKRARERDGQTETCPSATLSTQILYKLIQLLCNTLHDAN